jgi:hypothetical protein
MSRHFAIERDEEGRAARMVWMGDTPDHKRRGASECGFCGASLPTHSNPGSPRKHCNPEHRRAAWARDHPRVAIQKALSFQPPAVALIPLAVPPHDQGKREALHRAARHVLDLLQDGQPHSRHELEAVGGNRYAARIKAVRDALAGRGVVLGPLPQPRRGVFETEPLGSGGLELYRLRWAPA